jgi:predicted RNase H-like HicB family nuclease
VDEVLTAATRNLVTLEEEKAAVKLVPLRLTAQIEWSDGQCCAYCPELDLATAMDTEEEALTDLAEMAVEYAEDYLEDLAFYAKSPNRAEHLPFILAVAECTTDVYDVEGVRKVQELFESTHGATT